MTMKPAGDRPALSFVGAGRAGSALAVAFASAGYRIAAISSRTGAHARQLAAVVGAVVTPTPLEAARAGDLTLLTVPDSAITPVAAAIAASGAALGGRAVVHCSARLGPEAAAALHTTGAEVGVLHPMQAMSGAVSAPLLQGVTFRVEATGVLASRLEAMAGALQGNVIRIAPEDRDLYHAAAVLAGNAPLALLARATWLLQQAGVDEQTAHRALARLLEGAAANARAKSPAEALTGPVVRGDDVAIAAHVAALAPYPDVRALYEQLIAEMEQLVRPAEPAAPHTLRVA